MKPLFATTILTFCVLAGCEEPPPAKVVHVDPLPTVQQATPATAPAEEGPPVALQLTEATRFEDCHVLLNNDDGPLSQFPAQDPTPLLLGCGAEAFQVLSDNSLIIAYDSPRPDHPHDLRLVRWSAQGQRLWWHDLDRNAESRSFSANFRASWIADLSPKHVCAGTMWEGGTQGLCANIDDGTPIWSGRMNFWAGMKPVGFQGGLYVPDVSGLTQRYPFSGIEMRYRKFDGAGGRAALYLNTGDGLLFAPSRAEEPRLVAYDLKTFDARWRTQLPADPTANYGLVQNGVAVFEIGAELWAVDVDSGKALWKRPATSTRAPIAATDDTLFVLHRRDDQPNLLRALDLKSGREKWHGPTPLGTLTVHTDQDRVFLKSVRSVQQLLGTTP
jgi:outer membrane protein assembly factor BamB